MATGSQAPSLGFLTVAEHENQGAFGGYLVLNIMGRPLEFHCTAPVRPSRAQEILYGASLKPYLFGEQIGRALLDKAKAKPSLVFTDVEDALPLREHSKAPVVMVVDRKKSGGDRQLRIDGAHAPPARLHDFSIAGQPLAVARQHEADQARITELWQAHADEFDLLEPFVRIRDAIEEARKSAK